MVAAAVVGMPRGKSFDFDRQQSLRLNSYGERIVWSTPWSTFVTLDAQFGGLQCGDLLHAGAAR
jgi:hypothetical protein